MRFRTKTVIGVALIEVALLAVLVWSAVSVLRESNQAELTRRAQLGAKLIAASAKDAIISRDLARLDSITAEALQDEQFEFVRILDADGTVLASRGDPALLKRPVQTDTLIDLVDDAVYDWSEAVSAGGVRYGSVNLGVSTAPLQLLLGSARRWAIGIAALEMILVAIFSWLLGSYLTRQLELMRQGSTRLATGDFTTRVAVRGNDEIAETATAFNLMAQQLGESNARVREAYAQRVLAQRQLEDALMRAEDRTEQLNAIFDLSPDGFVSFDKRHKVSHVNPAFTRIVGLRSDDVYGLDERQFKARLSSLCADPTRFPDLLAVGASKFIANETVPGDPQRARERQLLDLVEPNKRVLQIAVRDADARTISRIVYFRDVTKEIQVEQMKSEFLAHAAHELRTPLASIFGFSELLVRDQFEPETTRDMLMTIHNQCAWLIKIVHELLDLARIESHLGKDFNLESVRLEPLVSEALFELAPDPALWPVECEFAAGLPPVHADRSKLFQVLTNVLGNAMKFSPAGGLIKITYAERHIATRGFVAIEVRDNGIGMTAEQASRVCERFYRADMSGAVPGTGLGMAIVKEIIELHGGHLDIDSSPGLGTSITIFLPASQQLTDEA